MHFLLIPDSQVYEIHLVIHHGVHVDGDAVPGEDLLGRDVKSPGPQINTPGGKHCTMCQYIKCSPVSVNAGQDKEKPRALRATRTESSESEDDSSLIFLNNLIRK